MQSDTGTLIEAPPQGFMFFFWIAKKEPQKTLAAHRRNSSLGSPTCCAGRFIRRTVPPSPCATRCAGLVRGSLNSHYIAKTKTVSFYNVEQTKLNFLLYNRRNGCGGYYRGPRESPMKWVLGERSNRPKSDAFALRAKRAKGHVATCDVGRKRSFWYFFR